MRRSCRRMARNRALRGSKVRSERLEFGESDAAADACVRLQPPHDAARFVWTINRRKTRRTPAGCATLPVKMSVYGEGTWCKRAPRSTRITDDSVRVAGQERRQRCELDAFVGKRLRFVARCLAADRAALGSQIASRSWRKERPCRPCGMNSARHSKRRRSCERIKALVQEPINVASAEREKKGSLNHQEAFARKADCRVTPRLPTAFAGTRSGRLSPVR